MGERRCEYGVLVGKLEERPRHIWENNIKLGFQEIGRGRRHD
jgi:hypothetical protein